MALDELATNKSYPFAYFEALPWKNEDAGKGL